MVFATIFLSQFCTLFLTCPEKRKNRGKKDAVSHTVTPSSARIFRPRRKAVRGEGSLPFYPSARPVVTPFSHGRTLMKEGSFSPCSAISFHPAEPAYAALKVREKLPFLLTSHRKQRSTHGFFQTTCAATYGIDSPHSIQTMRSYPRKIHLSRHSHW